MADMSFFNRNHHLKLHENKGGILTSLLILLFFVAAVGLPFILFVFTGNDAETTSNYNRIDEKTKPSKLSKLESEAAKKKDKPIIEDTVDTAVNENLKLAGLWKKHYQLIEKTANDLENSKIAIDDDTKYTEIFSQYKKNQMLKNIYTDEKLGKYIEQNLRDNLEKFVKILGDYLSDYKKIYVLKKVEGFVARLAYNDALEYLKDVMEAKWHYDMPTIFIENKYSGVAGISRKDRELEKYWFENEKIINAEKEFKAGQVYSDFLQFKSNTNVNDSTIIDYEEAFSILEKLDRLNTDFSEKYEDTPEVKPVADEIKSCIKDMTTIIISSIDNWLNELNDSNIDPKLKKAVLLAFISELKTKFNIVEKYETEKALKLWNSLISTLQATDEPKKTLILEYEELDKMLTILSAEMAVFVDKSVVLDHDDITILESRLTKIIDKSLMACWITENYIPEKSGEISNLMEMFESKIFKMLYDCMNSQKFSDSKFHKEWAAWNIIFSLIWKPGESRFGTNIDKMMKSKNLEFSDGDYANACIILESISVNLSSANVGTENEGFYKSSIYNAVGHIALITYDLFKLIKDKINGSYGNLSHDITFTMEKLTKILRFNIVQTVKLRTTVEGLILKKLFKHSIAKLDDVYDFLSENSTLNKAEVYKFGSERKLMKRFEQTLKTD